MHIFVYGTLKKAYSKLNSFTELFHESTEWLCDATIEGTLYMIDWYPALKLTGSGLVHGEIYRITSPDLLIFLDQYEEAITEEVYLEKSKQNGNVQADYIRKKMVVHAIECWVYVYMGTVRKEDLIDDGKFKMP